MQRKERTTSSPPLVRPRSALPTAQIARDRNEHALRCSCVVASGVDLNGDGFDDLLVGLIQEGVGGRVYIYFGNAGGTFDATPDAILDPGIEGNAFGSSLI